jgi:hypothetical protein
MTAFFKHSSRRAFLRGLGGTAIALPLLEYTHGQAWAGGNVTKRFVTVFSHGGTITNQNRGTKIDGTGNGNGEDWWRPADLASEDLVLGPIHQPLEPWREKLLVLESVDNRAGVEQSGYGAGGHGNSNVTCLTAADTASSGDDAVAQGPSIDHVVAERLAARQKARFDRIHLSVGGHQYGSPFFRGANERVSGEPDPATAWATIFDGVSADGPSPEFLRELAVRGSILDGVTSDFEAHKNRVSAKDRHIIEAHLDHLRKLEQELQNPAVCTPPAEITEECNQYGCTPEGAALHAEIIVAALRCGLTNVAVLEIADILTPWTDVGLLIDSAHGIGHSLGHYARDVGQTGPYASQHENWLQEMLANRQWRMSLLATILEGLDDPFFSEGGNTILDNSVVLYTSEFRDPATHTTWNLPTLLAGSGGGYFNTGRFIDYNPHAAGDPYTLEYDTNESNHNLFTSILHAMGENDDHFGNGHAYHEGPLPGLT